MGFYLLPKIIERKTTMEVYYIIAFDSTHHAISAEKLLLEEGREFLMIPTPREITSSCGLSIRVGQGDIQAAMMSIREKNLSHHGIFRVESQGGQRKLTRI
jgi:hypothetical protein